MRACARVRVRGVGRVRDRGASGVAWRRERDVQCVSVRARRRSSEMRDGFLGDENEIVLLRVLPRRPRYTESSSDCGITPRSTAALRYSVCTGVVSGISTFMPAGLTLVPAIFAYL